MENKKKQIWRKYGMSYQEALDIMREVGYQLTVTKQGNDVLTPLNQTYPRETNKTAILIWKATAE